MTNAIQLQTTLYEIAMHIGTSREPKILAKDAITSFVRQLNCSGALLCQKKKINTYYEPYYSTPKNLFSQEKTKSFLNKFCDTLQTEDESTMKPYSIQEHAGIYYHIFSLENFGKLILLRNTFPFSPTLTKALLPVCQKLSNALCTSLEAQKKTEELINFKTLIDTISEGLALFDENLVCIEINQSALKKFEYTYEEALGKDIFSVIAKEDHGKLQHLNKQEHAQSEWTLLKKGGGTFPAFVSGSNIIYKEKPARIVTFLDLTDIKEKEKQLYNQSRLAQMGEMISMIAHQWRQPLGAISASTIGIKTKIQMKKFDLTTDDGRATQEHYLMKKLDNISAYVEHLSNTIEDFRNFFKPNKEKTSVNLKQVINKALDILHPAIIDKHITIHKDITFQHSIETYHNEILQALLNILKNAIDNFEVQHIKSPNISISGYEEEGKFVILITDNGKGIPENIIEKIFNPYFSTKEDKNGTGLGLYMTKTMIEDHCKGLLSVKNMKEGVRFKITLT